MKYNPIKNYLAIFPLIAGVSNASINPRDIKPKLQTILYPEVICDIAGTCMWDIDNDRSVDIYVYNKSEIGLYKESLRDRIKIIDELYFLPTSKTMSPEIQINLDNLYNYYLDCNCLEKP